MPRTVSPSPTALATEREVQRAVWRQDTFSPGPGEFSEAEQDRLCAILNAVSDAVDSYLGGTALKRLRTEKYDGGTEFITLRYRPVLQIAWVRELDQDLVRDRDYAFYPETGTLRRLPALLGWWPPAPTATLRPIRWAPYPQAVEVSYLAGWAHQERDPAGNLTAVVYEPGGEGIREAVLLWCLQLWNVGPASFTYLITQGGAQIEQGMPPQVEKLLAPYIQPMVRMAP